MDKNLQKSHKNVVWNCHLLPLLRKEDPLTIPLLGKEGLGVVDKRRVVDKRLVKKRISVRFLKIFV